MSSNAIGSGFYNLTTGHVFIRTEIAKNTSRMVLLLPPFTEEMNKSRHLLSQLMLQLKQQGISSILPDHYGTGDSEGDLDQASVVLWRNDLQQLIQQLSTQGVRQLDVVAVRFGAIQLFDLLNSSSLPLTLGKVILWQPQYDAGRFWQQFLRLKIAEKMAAGEKLSQKQLEQQLETGHTIEVAGYPVSPAFYNSLQQLQPAFPEALKHKPLLWLEISALDNIALPVQQKRTALESLCQLTFNQLKLDPFWQTAELTQATPLIADTVKYLKESTVEDLKEATV